MHLVRGHRDCRENAPISGACTCSVGSPHCVCCTGIGQLNVKAAEVCFLTLDHRICHLCPGVRCCTCTVVLAWSVGD